MGDIIGGIIGGVGSLFGGSKGSKQAMTGYNYLTGKNGIQPYVNAGNQAEGDISTLLTSNDQNNPAFKNYLNSTGYQFQLGQGTQAITGSSAARGILNSGATAKALTQYGQGLAGQYFNNYLDQMGAVANRGLTASGQIGAAGTSGGAAAGNITQSGTSSGFGQLGSAAGSLFNYFGGI